MFLATSLSDSSFVPSAALFITAVLLEMHGLGVLRLCLLPLGGEEGGVLLPRRGLPVPTLYCLATREPETWSSETNQCCHGVNLGNDAILFGTIIPINELVWKNVRSIYFFKLIFSKKKKGIGRSINISYTPGNTDFKCQDFGCRVDNNYLLLLYREVK